MHKYLLFIFCFVLFTSCGEETEVSSTEDNFLIIGLTFGNCAGDCYDFFKLDKDMVYADREEVRRTFTSPISFNDEPMSNENALTEMIKLESEFPKFLVQTEETSFGCPDCGDWGAIHIYKNIDGERKNWTLDNQMESNPEEIQEWATSVVALIYELRN